MNAVLSGPALYTASPLLFSHARLNASQVNLKSTHACQPIARPKLQQRCQFARHKKTPLAVERVAVGPVAAELLTSLAEELVCHEQLGFNSRLHHDINTSFSKLAFLRLKT